MACVYTRALCGTQAPLVTVEVHLSNGLPAFNLVGLPEASVREAKERVRSAIINSGFEFPMRRITINLAPAELPKQGGRYDLAIAIGILAAANQLPKQALVEFEFAGELALLGQIRACVGTVANAYSWATSPAPSNYSWGQQPWSGVSAGAQITVSHLQQLGAWSMAANIAVTHQPSAYSTSSDRNLVPVRLLGKCKPKKPLKSLPQGDITSCY